MINLKEFRKVNSLTQDDLADFFHTGKSFVSQIENGKTKLPEERLTELLNNDKGWDISMFHVSEPATVQISNFTNSNVVGNGQLHVNSPQPPESPEEQSPDEDMVPVIPTNLYKEAEVNIVEYINDNEENVQWSPAVQQFPKTDVFYTVQTMAMYPHLHQGDILALKAVKRRTPIVNGELYAVDSVDLGILVRFIYDRGDRIELRGSESSDRFEPIFIDKADVYNIFRVVGLIRTNI